MGSENTRLTGGHEGDNQPLKPPREVVRSERSGDVLPLLQRQLQHTHREVQGLVRRLAHEHWTMLLVLATRLVGRNDAEDVVQEAFYDLAKYMLAITPDQAKGLFESSERLKKLICKIMARRAYDLLRRRGRRERLTKDGSENYGTLDDVAMPITHPCHTLELARLQRAYADLPPDQRIAHVLHYYYDFTDADFEEYLGLNKSTSRSRVRRATIALKRAMKVKL